MMARVAMQENQRGLHRPELHIDSVAHAKAEALAESAGALSDIGGRFTTRCPRPRSPVMNPPIARGERNGFLELH